MGQQQLLLIVLGVIVVSVAVAAGIQLFNINAEESAKDAMVSHCVNLGSMAQQHYIKPASMAGGAGTFDGSAVGSGNTWVLPTSLETDNYGVYTADIDAQSVVITGDPFAYGWEIEATVTPTGIVATVTPAP